VKKLALRSRGGKRELGGNEGKAKRVDWKGGMGAKKHSLEQWAGRRKKGKCETESVERES